MAKAKAKSVNRKSVRTSKNGKPGDEKISELGRILMKIREQHVASGAKLLTLREVRREIANAVTVRGEQSPGPFSIAVC